MTTNDDEYLMLSGIQHFAFCERQWALIHIEQQWSENVLTVEGNHLHQRVDDWDADETRGRLRVIRSMPLASERLGIRGVADVVEFHRTDAESDETLQLDGRDGYWKVVPVEYKRGKPKSDDRDEVQLCAQILCLEEMLHVRIAAGHIFYASIRRRDIVDITDRLRSRVEELIMKMNSMFKEGRTPRAVYTKACESCSLISLCNPKWSAAGAKSASSYVKRHVVEAGDET